MSEQLSNSIYLSIIIPVYNVKDYLHKCVDSIVNQTYSLWELILVDDGSTDGSEDICDEYAALDSRIHVIHQANAGHTAARIAGMNASLYDYITFVDSDDWVEPETYERMCEPISKYGAQIVQCNLRAVYQNRIEEKGHTFPEGFYDKQSFGEQIVPHMIYLSDFYKFGLAPSLCNKVFFKEILKPHLEAVDRTLHNGEDGLAVYPTLLECDGYYILHGFFYNYRSMQASMCRALDDSRLVENHRLFESYQRIFGGDPNIMEQIYHYVVYQTVLAINSLTEGIGLKGLFESIRIIRLLKLNIGNDNIEAVAFRHIRFSEICGKKNRLIYCMWRLMP